MYGANTIVFFFLLPVPQAINALNAAENDLAIHIDVEYYRKDLI